MAECRSCGAVIEWVRTENDKRMPIDADPVPDGNLLKVERRASPDGMVDVVRYIKRGQSSEGGSRYVSHFATCKDSSAWRR